MRLAATLALIALAACTSSVVADAGPSDLGPLDGGTSDGDVDAHVAAIDAGPHDTGTVDSGVLDLGVDALVCPARCDANADCAGCYPSASVACCDSATRLCYPVSAEPTCPPPPPLLDAGTCDFHCTTDIDCQFACPTAPWRCVLPAGTCML